MGVKVLGRPQRHEATDPISVETQVRGEIPRSGMITMAWDRTCIRRQVGYSVACLEWRWWIPLRTLCGLDRTNGATLGETISAKEAMNRVSLWRKTSRLTLSSGIKV